MMCDHRGDLYCEECGSWFHGNTIKTEKEEKLLNLALRYAHSSERFGPLTQAFYNATWNLRMERKAKKLEEKIKNEQR